MGVISVYYGGYNNFFNDVVVVPPVVAVVADGITKKDAISDANSANYIPY